MASFLAGPVIGDPGARSMRARCRCSGPVVALQMRTTDDTARGLPGGAAGPARPRRRAARRGRDRRRAPERRRLPDRAVGAADAVLRPAARAHRGAPGGRARPRARARLSRAASRRCSRHHGCRSETRRHLAGEIAAWLWHPEGATGARRARPRPLRRARPAPARLRRALRRGRPRRAALRLPPLRRQRRRAAPALRHPAPSSTTGAPRSPTRAACRGSSASASSAPPSAAGTRSTLAAESRGRAPSSRSAR